MDTIDEMVLRGPLDWRPPHPPSRRRRLRWGIPLVVLSVLLVAAVEVDVPYYAIAPGTARPVNDLIAVPRERAIPPRGQLLLATVSLRRVSAFEAVTGWLDGDTDIVPEETILGTTDRRDFATQNLSLMDDSKTVAVVVALRRLGLPVAEKGRGGVVTKVERGSPADGRIREGEVITAVDGKPTPLSQSVVDAVRARKPGDRVRLDVLGVEGAARTVEVTLAPGRDPGAAVLGVVLRTKERAFDLPFTVNIDSGTIGGPSAGLAFTLGLLDILTPGELTGGRRVAVTGTIELDGRVGEVGGVAQKTAAVREAGADYFLVPPGEYAEAVAHAGKRLRVRRATSVDEALAELAKLGGQGLASPPWPTSPPGRS